MSCSHLRPALAKVAITVAHAPPGWPLLLHLPRRDLRGNSISGPIPSTLGALTALEELLLGSNLLTGRLASSLAHLTALRYLDVSANRLVSSLPTELGAGLTSLETVLLGENYLSASLPTELGHWSSLERLECGTNGLNGPFPAQLGAVTALKTLKLSGNALTGTLAAMMNSPNLTVVDVHGNAFTGPVPTTIGTRSQLTELYVGDNDLSGTLPTELGGLTALEVLSLSDNPRVVGTLPDVFWNLTSLVQLEVAGLSLHGTIPASLAALPALQTCELTKSDSAEVTNAFEPSDELPGCTLLLVPRPPPSPPMAPLPGLLQASVQPDDVAPGSLDAGSGSGGGRGGVNVRWQGGEPDGIALGLTLVGLLSTCLCISLALGVRSCIRREKRRVAAAVVTVESDM